MPSPQTFPAKSQDVPLNLDEIQSHHKEFGPSQGIRFVSPVEDNALVFRWPKTDSKSMEGPARLMSAHDRFR
ncbi:hypothetical protein WCLP8_1440002 [uncultured Gammaproteobacteria bacterium]